jgi:hypothetical protein
VPKHTFSGQRRGYGLILDGDELAGQANVRWIERQGKIPDGPSVGEPFRSLEFQREVIRGIYADPVYWAAVKLVVKKRRAA